MKTWSNRKFNTEKRPKAVFKQIIFVLLSLSNFSNEGFSLTKVKEKLKVQFELRKSGNPKEKPVFYSLQRLNQSPVKRTNRQAQYSMA